MRWVLTACSSSWLCRYQIIFVLNLHQGKNQIIWTSKAVENMWHGRYQRNEIFCIPLHRQMPQETWSATAHVCECLVRRYSRLKRIHRHEWSHACTGERTTALFNLWPFYWICHSWKLLRWTDVFGLMEVNTKAFLRPRFVVHRVSVEEMIRNGSEEQEDDGRGRCVIGQKHILCVNAQRKIKWRHTGLFFILLCILFLNVLMSFSFLISDIDKKATLIWFDWRLLFVGVVVRAFWNAKSYVIIRSS